MLGVPSSVESPTCSVNLICHRNGNLQIFQFQVIRKEQCAEPDQFKNLIAENEALVHTDIQFLKTMRKVYEKVCTESGGAYFLSKL